MSWKETMEWETGFCPAQQEIDKNIRLPTLFSIGSLSSAELLDLDDSRVKRRFITEHHENLDQIQQDCANGAPMHYSVHDPSKREWDEYSASTYGGTEH
eukprot:1005494-Ditylum_brightwellii.AAC.2